MNCPNELKLQRTFREFFVIQYETFFSISMYFGVNLFIAYAVDFLGLLELLLISLHLAR